MPKIIHEKDVTCILGWSQEFFPLVDGVDAPQCIKKTMKIYVVKCKKKEEKIIEIVGVALFLN